MTNQLEKNYQVIEKHINAMAADCLKPPKPPLQFPFIDPGSVYDGNLWDWDFSGRSMD